MNKRKLCSAVLALWGTTVVFAQEGILREKEKINELEEVVISDSKFKLKREQSGKVITKIIAQDLERSQGQSVAAVLDRVAGIELNGSSSVAGQNLGYFIRGGRDRQVVIRVDGITVSDPSSIAGNYDLRLLAIDQVQEIEILKGASSTLYGSGAATAVINIISKSAGKSAISAQFSSSIGTNQSQEDQGYDVTEFINAASIHGTVGKMNYKASFSNHYADGLSAATPLEGDTSNTRFENDPFSKYNVSAKLGYQITENFKCHVFGNLDRYTNEFDQGSGAEGQNKSSSEQLRAGSYWEYTYPNGSFVFADSYALLERVFETDFPSKSESRVYTFDAYTKYIFFEKLHAVLGANGSYSDYNDFSANERGQVLTQTINDHQADFDIIDPYLNLVYTSGFGLNINAGGRLNTHSAYGTHFVYSINPSYSYTFGSHTLKGLASYSTAYITPSLFQLYAPSFGNETLEPEENATIEGGIELSFAKKARVSVVYFSREENNFIDFVTDSEGSGYKNVTDQFRAEGVEVVWNAKCLNDKLALRANYTYTKIDSDLLASKRVRIPEHKINATLGYQCTPKTFTSVSYQFTEDRKDQFFNTATFVSEAVQLDAYGVLDFYASHKIIDNFTIYATITNITNEAYQEVIGFSTQGRNVRLGINLSF